MTFTPGTVLYDPSSGKLFTVVSSAYREGFDDVEHERIYVISCPSSKLSASIPFLNPIYLQSAINNELYLDARKAIQKASKRYLQVNSNYLVGMIPVELKDPSVHSFLIESNTYEDFLTLGVVINPYNDSWRTFISGPSKKYGGIKIIDYNTVFSYLKQRKDYLNMVKGLLQANHYYQQKNISYGRVKKRYNRDVQIEEKPNPESKGD